MVQVAAGTKGQSSSASLPPIYALELLTIFAWEQGCGEDGFLLACGLRSVLELVLQHPRLCVYWTVNYSAQDPVLRTHLLGQLSKPRFWGNPVTLYPALIVAQKGSGPEAEELPNQAQNTFLGSVKDFFSKPRNPKSFLARVAGQG